MPCIEEQLAEDIENKLWKIMRNIVNPENQAQIVLLGYLNQRKGRMDKITDNIEHQAIINDEIPTDR